MKFKGRKVIAFVFILVLLLCPARTESTKGKHYRKNHTHRLTTYYLRDNEKQYCRYESYYKKNSIFGCFDKEFFDSHMLPNTTIQYRHNTGSVEGSELITLAEQALQEIRSGSRAPSNFIVIKAKNYDYRDHTGLMVLKYKDHPFILKLFVETPESFLLPQKKGLEHKGMYLISGGINRFLSGSYRIKNIERIKQEIAKHEEWENFIDFPRKWHWLPESADWFEVRGENFNTEEPLYTQLPNVYAIIADEIVSDTRFKIIKKEYGRQIFNFCKALHFRPDPNIKNFLLEKETNKLVMIDTEYFAPLIGMSPESMERLHGYWDLHVYAASRFLKEGFWSVMR